MASPFQDEATSNDASQLAGSSSSAALGMFNDEFVFTDSDEPWSEQEGPNINNSQEQDIGMDNLATNMDTFGSIDLDQQAFEDVLDGRQANSTFSDPILSYAQGPGMPIASRHLDVDQDGAGNGEGEQDFQLFFKEMVESGLTEEGSAPQRHGTRMGFVARADKLDNAPRDFAPQFVSNYSQPRPPINAELEDVFGGDGQFGMLQFQQQLHSAPLQTGPFHLQEPPRFVRTTSTKPNPATQHGQGLRIVKARNVSGPPPIPQVSPTRFSAGRRQRVARKDESNKNDNSPPAEVVDTSEQHGRVNKRPRVAPGAKKVQGGQQQTLQSSQTRILSKVPEHLILRSDPVDAQAGNFFGAQSQSIAHTTGILRPQPRMANQQIAAPRKPGLDKPGMGMFQLQANHSPPPQSLNRPNNQLFTSSSQFGTFGLTILTTPDRLSGPPSMIAGPQVAPSIPSPLTPSLRFPFEVFKYPTGEHYTNYLTAQVIKVLYENFYQDVTGIRLKVTGRSPPTTLIDTAVNFFKEMHWDNPIQLNMIYLITILHNSQQTNLHQWLWEIFIVASVFQKNNPQCPTIYPTIELIKWQVVRLTMLLLKHDMTEFSTRESPIFGRRVGPATWTVQHGPTTIWDVLNLHEVKDEPGMWVTNFTRMANTRFMVAGINPHESLVPKPQEEDGEGFI